jgi:hypothetical protein
MSLISCTSVRERVVQRGVSSPKPSVIASEKAEHRNSVKPLKLAGAVQESDEDLPVNLPLPSSNSTEKDASSALARSTGNKPSGLIHDPQIARVSSDDRPDSELADPDPPAPDIVIPRKGEHELPAPSTDSPEAKDKDGPEGDAKRKGEITLVDAPLEEGDLAYPINLASAMRLADARPLVIAAAQAGAWVAEAQLQRAQVIWVPTLNLGGDYVRHDGYGPDFNRALNTSERPLSQNINFLYAGAGATAAFALTDAIYEPLAQRQVLNSRRMDIQTAKNDALLATAKAYFDVHQSRGQYAGALDTVKRGEKLVERISFLSQDLVPKVEADRAKRMLAGAQQNAAAAREKWRVASANLTQVLRLDPRVIVDPAEQDHLQITLFDPARPLDELIPIALCNRPELSSQQSLVAGVAERIRREKGRILMPSIMLNGFQTPNEYLQVGAQGFGANKNLNLWSVRDDFSPQVLWQLDALGIGNAARIKEQRGEQSRSIVELFKTQDMVAADVTRAQAKLQSAAVRTIQAERAMHEAIITYDGNYDGLAQTKRFDNILVQVYRPQEAVIALADLVYSYDEYFTTVAEYNRAQFEMFHALGYPALDASHFNPPGEVQPVDTSRPHFLPPVESGPPAATR